MTEDEQQGLREGAEGHRARRERQDRRRVQADDQGARGGRPAVRWSTRRPASRSAASKDAKELADESERFKLEALDLRSPEQAEAARRSSASTGPRIEALLDEKDRKLEHLKRGDELPSGVLEMVKVYVATKRRHLGRRQDGRPARQQGRHRQDPARRGHAVPGRRHAGRHPAEPAGRAEPHERRPDPRDPPGLGGGQARVPGDQPGLRRRHRGRRSASASRRPACPRTARRSSTTAAPASRSSSR